MSDKYLYRDIQTADRGRGYGAVDILAKVSYFQAVAMFVFNQWQSFHDGFGFTEVITSGISLLELATTCLGIYVLRLAVRAVLVLRDSAAHDKIDQDARYKTSSST